jgi:hypothetical protein
MESSGPRVARRDVRRGGSAALGVAVGAALLLFAVVDAGFPRTLWLAVAVFFVALAAVVALSFPGVFANVPRPTLIAVTALFAFAGWCFLSILWADARADAWDGANRTLLYATLYALVALWPWRPSTAVATVLAFSVGVALIGAATLRAAGRASSADGFFIDGVFAEPSGYHNANAALFLVAFWPALLFAARAETPVSVRPLLLAAAGALLELAMLAQSRGSLIALPASAAVILVVFAGRLRVLVALVPVAIAALVARDPLLGVFTAVRRGDASVAIRDAGTALAISVAALGVAGIALALLDRRVSIPAGARTFLGRTVLAVAAVAAVVGVGVAAASDPLDRVDAAWADFKQYRPERSQADTHFGTGLGSNRYDFWRVSLSEFAASPVHGIGADNFAVPYLRERRSDEEPLYPHSFVLGVLSQTGLVGAALVCAFFAAALTAAARGRRAGPDVRTLTVTGVAVATYFLVHSSGEWLWELPGVAAPMLVALALPAGAARSGLGPARRRPGLAAAIVLLASCAVASLALPGLAARLTEDAARSWRSDPARAFDRLELAGRLNPLSERPDLTAAAIASRRGEWGRMRAAAEQALLRKPGSWYAELQLAVVDAVERRPDASRAHLARAEALNPREPAIELARERLRSGEPLRPAELDELFLRRVSDRNG